MQLIQIGHDGPKVAPIGMGTWAWGDTLSGPTALITTKKICAPRMTPAWKPALPSSIQPRSTEAAAQSNCWAALRPPILTSMS